MTLLREIYNKNPISFICANHTQGWMKSEGINLILAHQYKADEYAFEISPKTSPKPPVFKNPQDEGPSTHFPSGSTPVPFPFPPEALPLPFSLLHSKGPYSTSVTF